MNSVNDLLFLVFPEICAACGNSLWKNEEILCTSCLYHLPKTRFVNDSENPVSQVFYGRIQLEYAGAYLYFSKGGRVQKLIHQLKYRGRREVGVKLGELFGGELLSLELNNPFNRIIPVPLHPRKLALRGYNQAEAIGEGLSARLQIPMDTVSLVRQRKSATQTRKSRFSRWENVAEIFSVKEPGKLAGQHLLLVDDVITTGATIESCAAALLSVPGVRISVAAAAVARR